MGSTVVDQKKVEVMQTLLERIHTIRIVPVIAIDDAAQAIPLAKALIAGGIPCAEITFRTAAAAESIAAISAEVPAMLVGAGTVLSREQADRAKAAGAAFAVSPGFNPHIVDYCGQIGLPIIPGCSSPSDMEQAIERGLQVVKFFPAEQTGGLPFLKAVAAPYTGLRFMPTGGIGPQNLAEYLSFSRVIACGGSWMAKPEMIAAGRFDEIAQLCRKAADIAENTGKA